MGLVAEQRCGDVEALAAHVLDGASNYQNWLIQTPTKLPATNTPNWRFSFADLSGDGRADMYAINTNDSGKTAVHILDGATKYQEWLLQTETVLGTTNEPKWRLGVDGGLT